VIGAGGAGRTGALVVALPRMAAHAPFPGDDQPALTRQVRALEALSPDLRAALVGPRGWEARALLPPGWRPLSGLADAAAWSEGLDRLLVAAVVRPGVESWRRLDPDRLAALSPRRWTPAAAPGDPWVRMADLGGGVTCLREPLALLAPSLDTDWVNAFHVAGAERSLLIDCGCGVADYGGLVRPAPAEVVLTHGDWDHAGGRLAFGRVRCHPADFPALRRRPPVEFLRQGLARLGRPEAGGFSLPRGSEGVSPLREGERLDLGGGVSLRVLHAPGHTPGEVALWDAASGRLYAGDAAYAGPLYAEDPEAFAASAVRLASLPGVTEVLGGHGPVPAPAELLRELAGAAAAVRDGRAGPGAERGPFVEHAFDLFSIVVPRRRRPS
jgi:glyoxylase-like metal-dependent hydrolase (beta-lactamase superfamily II)